MYGPQIEKQFQHVTFENEQQKRKLEVRRMLDTEQPHQTRSPRSLADMFKRFVSGIDRRTPVRRSPVRPNGAR